MMRAINLPEEVDRASAEMFSERRLSDASAARLRDAVESRIVAGGRDAGMLLPAEREYASGVRLFTGELLRTKLAARNVLTVESARLLAAAGIGPEILSPMKAWIDSQCFAAGCTVGECAHSGIAYARFLAADEPAESARCLASLPRSRDGKGGWRGHPHFYTLLALTEMPREEARAELGYAAGFSISPGNARLPEKYLRRREILLERVRR